MKSCSPSKLPLLHLKWEKIAGEIKKARLAVRRLNATLKEYPCRAALLSSLKERESVAAVESQKEIAGLASHYKKALELGIKTLRREPLNFALIKKMHAEINRESVPAERGHFRKRQNWIGPEGGTINEAYFYPPSPKHLPPALQNWKKYQLLEERDPLVKIAITFAQFLILHPFMEGNGRVARALLPALFFKEKITPQPLLYLSAYFKKERAAYCEKLYNITMKDDWEGWIVFFLKGVEEEARYENRLARSVKVNL